MLSDYSISILSTARLLSIVETCSGAMKVASAHINMFRPITPLVTALEFYNESQALKAKCLKEIARRS